MRTFRIDRLAKMTGLSKHVLRAGKAAMVLSSPNVVPTGIFSIPRKMLNSFVLSRANWRSGHSIGDLTMLGREELLNRMTAAAHSRQDEPPYERLLISLLVALDPLDLATFKQALNETIALLPFEEALHRVLVPLQIQVGELWHEGRIEVTIEHFVTKHV